LEIQENILLGTLLLEDIARLASQAGQNYTNSKSV